MGPGSGHGALSLLGRRALPAPTAAPTALVVTGCTCGQRGQLPGGTRGCKRAAACALNKAGSGP